jgi:outer membrane protein assembly factor BamD (BamD/ComL family)
VRLLIGRIYQDAGDYEEAVTAYEDVIIHHGRHPLAREAVYHKAVCLEKISRRNPRDEHRMRVALQSLYAALREGLSPEQAATAQALVESLQTKIENLYYEQATFYDRRGENQKAALIGYRSFLQRFPNSEKSEDVRERIKTLEASQTTD